jgi:hypothetical protein
MTFVYLSELMANRTLLANLLLGLLLMQAGRGSLGR